MAALEGAAFGAAHSTAAAASGGCLLVWAESRGRRRAVIGAESTPAWKQGAKEGVTNPSGRAEGATRAPTRGERPALLRAGTVQPRGPGCSFARAPLLIFNFLRGADGTVPGVPAALRERGAGAAAAGTSLHRAPRRAAPRAGRRVGKAEHRAPGLSYGADPAVPGRGARAALPRSGGAALPPAPPRPASPQRDGAAAAAANPALRPACGAAGRTLAIVCAAVLACCGHRRAAWWLWPRC